MPKKPTVLQRIIFNIIFSEPFHRLATVVHLLTFHNTFRLFVQLCTRTLCLTVYLLLMFIKMDVYLLYPLQSSEFVYI